jgi:hypothetical protein
MSSEGSSRLTRLGNEYPPTVKTEAVKSGITFPCTILFELIPAFLMMQVSVDDIWSP